VFVDGLDVGRTPLVARNLGRGTHTVEVSRGGYSTEQYRVLITAERPEPSLTVEMTRGRAAAPAPTQAPAAPARSGGALVVDSRPSGATVFVDEKMVGTTPLSLDTINAGDHVVRLERDGYAHWTSSVRVVAGEPNRVTASLER
jgi:hypothetical protein